jgi:hypothetical protein
MDAPIRNLTRPSVARVCVLVDLLKDMPKASKKGSVVRRKQREQSVQELDVPLLLHDAYSSHSYSLPQTRCSAFLYFHGISHVFVLLFLVLSYLRLLSHSLSLCLLSIHYQACLPELISPSSSINMFCWIGSCEIYGFFSLFHLSLSIRIPVAILSYRMVGPLLAFSSPCPHPDCVKVLTTSVLDAANSLSQAKLGGGCYRL